MIENADIILLNEAGDSDPIEFVYRGIRYVPNENYDNEYWSNRFIYKDCNYLKYQPKTSNIVATK